MNPNTRTTYDDFYPALPAAPPSCPVCNIVPVPVPAAPQYLYAPPNYDARLLAIEEKLSAIQALLEDM